MRVTGERVLTCRHFFSPVLATKWEVMGHGPSSLCEKNGRDHGEMLIS